MAETLLRTQEVAALLRVHPKHVYRLLKKGLPARRVGGEWRFSREDVLVWSGGREAAPEAGAERGPAPAGEAAPPSIVAANGDVVVLALLELAARLGPPLIGFVQSDNRGAAQLLAAGAVLAAGAHAGGFPAHLGSERVARLHLVTREVGLLGRAGSRPPQLKELARLRLASRAPTAGVRGYLDQALEREGLPAEKIHRRALVLGSHLEVVCAVAAGRADVGLGSRAWGERAGLSFTPLATEAYGLIVKARDLGDPRVVRLCEVAQGAEFRARVGAIPGYDAAGAGDIRYDA
jgi:putative molybdopterin biosynthesis protein